MRMVDRHIAGRGIENQRVLDAMATVRREDFLPEHLRDRAYEDRPLPIGGGQTISQPYVVALMADAADIGAEDTVLEVGTGSGYGAAVLSHLAARVHTIERLPELADAARGALVGHPNVEVHSGDGTEGWPGAAPYDAIVVTAAAESVPEALTAQLAPGGRLMIPVGAHHGSQQLLCIERLLEDPEELRTTDLGGVAFVPLIGDG